MPDSAKNVMKTPAFWAHLVLTVLSFACFFLVMMFWILQRPLNFSGPSVIFEVQKDMDARSIIAQLNKKNVLRYPNLTYWTIKLNGLGRQIRAGEYQIRPDESTIALIQALYNGLVYYRNITFVEGWTFRQLRDQLDQAPAIHHDTVGMSAHDLKLALGIEEKHLEGLFYPDTYFYVKGVSDIELLRRAHQAMTDLLARDWATRAANLPYHSPYQALIAASLIEKETANHAEKPIIAGVIATRLKKRMRLQIDPTVIFALGHKHRGILSRNDLKTKSKYNTYLHYGLPPSPIGIPGQVSIQAALHPSDSNYLYYLAKHDGNHVFSSSYREHRNAYQRYIKHRKSS